MLKVYLAGSIGNLSYKEATEWRQKVRAELINIAECISPMRNKEHLANEKSIQDHYPGDVSASSKSVFHRDTYDVRRCDVLLVNLDTMKTRGSVGTMFETGYAYASNKLIVFIDSKNRFDHPFLNESGVTCASLDDAIMYIKSLRC